MSKETKWTPGPWVAEAGTTTGMMVSAPHAAKCKRAVSRNGGPDREANAHLIAAAPELYEALMQAKKELEDIAMAEICEPYNNLQINAALAKARGES